jgi:hypothetical protein
MAKTILKRLNVILYDTDADIDRWLAAQDDQSEAVRQAIRQAMASEENVEDVVRRVVREELQRVQITAESTEEQPSPEKLEAERKLDQMF